MCVTPAINVTLGLQVSWKINVIGDLCDILILGWDTDKNFANGCHG